jgi:hypothetical protein
VEGVVSESFNSTDGEEESPRGFESISVEEAGEEFPERRSAGTLSFADLERCESLRWIALVGAARREREDGVRAEDEGRMVRVVWNAL